MACFSASGAFVVGEVVYVLLLIRYPFGERRGEPLHYTTIKKGALWISAPSFSSARRGFATEIYRERRGESLADY